MSISFFLLSGGKNYLLVKCSKRFDFYSIEYYQVNSIYRKRPYEHFNGP